jgi:hypothetical protein
MLNMSRTKWFPLFVLVIAALINGSRAHAVEAGADVSEEKIKSLVGDPGNEDFAKRQAAQKELGRIGAKAKAALEAVKESPDAQVKASATQLLGRLKFLDLGPVNYLDLLPQTSLIVARATNAASLADNSRKTALGKLIDSVAFAPLKEKVMEQLNKEPDTQKKVMNWLQRFNGQAAGAIMTFNPMQPGGTKMAAMAEITDPSPAAVYDDVLEATRIGDNGTPGVYSDVAYIQGAQDQGAIALLGKHLVLANNLAALKDVIDAFATPGKYAASDAYSKIKPGLGANPDLQMVIDLESLVKAVLQIPLPFPLPMEDILSVTHLKNIKAFALSSSAAGDSFEDRYVTVRNGPPDAAAAAMIPPADVVPLNIAAIAPQASVAFAASYVDGPKFYQGMLESFASMKKLQDAVAAFSGGAQQPDAEEKIKEFEAKFGVKVSDIAAAMKGEVAVWVVPAASILPAPPDFCIVVSSPDEDKAAFLSDALATVLNKLQGVPVIKELDYKNHKIRQIDMEALQAKQSSPYTPAWVADKNRVFIGSSVALLQKQLLANENKAPGLLVQAEFVKTLGSFAANERKGSFFYVDLKTLLTVGATIGVPVLQMNNPNEDLKKVLAGLPPFAELFKDVPPLVGSMIVEGDEEKVIVRAAVPPTVTLLGVLIGVTVYSNRGMMQELMDK